MTVCLFAAVLFFGLQPKGFDFKNHAAFLVDRGGIRFEKYSVAHTQPSMLWHRLLDEGEAGAFSISLSFQPDKKKQEGFAFIAVVHGGRDREQLLIGQWRSWVIVMNGDDYDHKRKSPRISINTAALKTGEIVLTITSGSGGTCLFVDGELLQQRRHMRLDMPEGKARLVLGNSVYGSHPWYGVVYSFWCDDRALTKNDIREQLSSWYRKQNSAHFAPKPPPVVLRLSGKGGLTAENDAENDRAVRIMPGIPVVAPRFLSMFSAAENVDRGFVLDAVVNVLGFVPLGMVLFFMMMRFDRLKPRTAAWIVVAACCCLSLGIEVLQAWMPSRSSSGMDLVFNTLGGAGGAVVGAQRCKVYGVRYRV